MGDATTGGREAKLLGLAVELAPCNTSLGTCSMGIGIYPYTLHRREVYNDTPFAHRVAGYGMSLAAHRHHQLIVADEVHTSHNVGHATTTGDQGWMPVDHAVKHGASSIIPLVVGPNQLAAEVRCEFLDGRFLKGFA